MHAKYTATFVCAITEVDERRQPIQDATDADSVTIEIEFSRPAFQDVPVNLTQAAWQEYNDLRKRLNESSPHPFPTELRQLTFNGLEEGMFDSDGTVTFNQ